MIDDAPLRLVVSVITDGNRGNVQSSVARWRHEDAERSAKTRAEARIGLGDLGPAHDVSVALVASLRSKSFGGFVVLRYGGEDQICWSFTCPPRISQSMGVRMDAQHSLEVMVISDVPKPS